MANKYTQLINDVNVMNVRNQIAKKKSYNPYIATVEQSAQVITDYDTFPYPRYFRGIPQSSQAIVAEREAGWRTRHDDCYKVQTPVVTDHNNYPDHCFETACGTTFPCYPQSLSKHTDRKALNVMLNNACIVQYR